MIRSVLLALDGSAASKTATELAMQFVKRQARETLAEVVPIQLTGIAVLDRPTITKREAVPVGGGAFKKERTGLQAAFLGSATRTMLQQSPFALFLY